MVPTQKQKYTAMGQFRKPRDKPTFEHLIFDKGGKNTNREMPVFSISGTGKTVQLQVKE